MSAVWRAMTPTVTATSAASTSGAASTNGFWRFAVMSLIARTSATRKISALLRTTLACYARVASRHDALESDGGNDGSYSDCRQYHTLCYRYFPEIMIS